MCLALRRRLGAGETRSLVISTFNLAGLDEIMPRVNTDREEMRAKNQALDQTKMEEAERTRRSGRQSLATVLELAESQPSPAAQTGLHCCFEYRLKNPRLR